MREISPTEAKDMLERDPQAVYLDVRSSPEFREGRPAGALHAALMEKTPPLMRWLPNPSFVDQVKALVGPDKTLICGCQMGARSARAAQILEGAGYKSVFNMRGGFSGARDPASGEILERGWSQLHYPVERG